MNIKTYFAALFIGLLSSCAKQPVENHRYFLPEAQLTQRISKPSAEMLQISDVRLADFLTGGGLVLQLDDITLNQAKNHLWADDLRQQINRALRDRLNQRQQPFTVVGPQTAADLRLSLIIDAFHGRHDGLAITSGQWQLHNAEGELLKLKNFHLQTKLQQPGYPAMVRALGDNLDDLATALAAMLSEKP
ncbi:MAG TPA: ABC-type transport auxiliary lipoprotein family protein [Methylophaga sp.]|nr:ABC-type transport auxiliary lipoprotein family protein [Methylophaga sp.]